MQVFSCISEARYESGFNEGSCHQIHRYLLSAIPAIGASGIWWSVPIGWGLADLVGFLYYKVCKKIYCLRVANSARLF